MKVLYAVLVIILGFVYSCSDPLPVNPAESELNPFTNGSSERNIVVAISDIHLGADLSYAEIKNNLPYLVTFLEKVRVSPNVKELVLAGDIIDEWFVPADVDTYNGKDQHDFVQRVASANKAVVDVFNRIIQEGKIKVTYAPGNHDLAVTAVNVAEIFPGINQARDDIQGLGTYYPDGLPQIAIEHGHRYNFYVAPDPISNKDIAPGSIMPPGYFFTRIATLHVVQNCKIAGDTISNITANQSGGESQELVFIYWKVWKALFTQLPIENKLDEKIIITNIDGFTERYAVNDILPYQLSPGGHIDMNLFRGIQDTWNERQTINKVPVNIPASQAIAYGAISSQTDIQAKTQYFLNSNSDTRVVIFGHTHEAKIIASENHRGQKSVYANTGTWIDHNPNKTTMNFIVITPQSSGNTSQTYIKLYNFEGGVFSEMSADSLRF
ncbi:MAG: metallophosphoesterase [Ignavibacteriaceae bacterium]